MMCLLGYGIEALNLCNLKLRVWKQQIVDTFMKGFLEKKKKKAKMVPSEF